MSVSDLPALNAILNGISTVLLTAGFIFIKAGNRLAHRNCMVAAFCTSAVFLITYVTHKVLKGSHTPFGGEGFIRNVYYLMLISHVLLAMAIVPLVLVTIKRARRGDFEAHKRIARWTWPIWMYVSVTGVVIYLLLYQIFPQH
jgi:putative membrane protein